MAAREELPVFRKYNKSALVPASNRAVEVMASYSEGDLVVVNPRKRRNLAHHNKFFALLHKVAENQEFYPNADALLKALKFGIAHVDEVVMPDGEVRFTLASIDHESMDQTEFNQFYKRAGAWLIENVIPGLDDADLQREVGEMTV